MEEGGAVCPAILVQNPHHSLVQGLILLSLKRMAKPMEGMFSSFEQHELSKLTSQETRLHHCCSLSEQSQGIPVTDATPATHSGVLMFCGENAHPHY